MVRSIDRRRFVQVMGGGLAVGAAGCLGGDDGGDENGSENGDDGENGDGSAGLAYALGPDTIALVDPADGEVVDEITEGVDGYEYGDAVVTNDGSQLFVIEETLSQVLVIDTESRGIVAEVGMGPDGTHMYHPNDDEMWAHSDEEGTFYVIDTESHEVTETVEAGLEGEGHGKLLYHEDFGDEGYATNVNDPALHVIDLDDYERTNSIELGEEGGTHYKAYSPANGLAYVEYGDVTAVVDTETDEVVDELDVAGGMYLTPDEERMAIVDHGEIHLFDVTDETEEIGSLEVEGGPDDLEYYEADGTLYGFTANTMDSDSVVVDMDELEEVDRIDAGDIERPEDAEHLHRSAVSGGGYFFTSAEADGTVAVIDMAERELIEQVEVENGVATVAYIPE
ncbi:YncE family protein [Natronorubrum sp. FCH18a]|uniref:YncE family protein n=1 Tax=Natronorubrum sp. FCH18a TaxID=3447018 RepID=UPI003F50EE07